MKEEEQAAQLLQALGHPLRFKILDFISTGERCVCEVMSAADVKHSLVSRHLSVLRQACVLESRREKTRVFYRVRDPAVLTICELARAIIVRRKEELAKLLATMTSLER
ncbi:MAG: ArsR/SmtB family transcription factor [Desulfofundulus sp.]|uniref:ArsR/SmtB family transcription factor n=1 Tax=Desulfofundulus sp. TaxID=2282750 RepID=UPI003C74BCE0